MEKSQKRRLCQLTSVVLCSPLLDFLNLEDGIEKLTQNVGRELPLYTIKYLRRAQTSHDDLALQALVWLLVVRF
jgi:hypothetical protein